MYVRCLDNKTHLDGCSHDETGIIIITIIIMLVLATTMAIKPILCVIRRHVHDTRSKPNLINNSCSKTKRCINKHRVNEDFGVLWGPSSSALLVAIRRNLIIMKRQ